MAASHPHFVRRRAALLTVLAATAALSLRSLLAPRLRDALVDEGDNEALSIEREKDARFRRMLLGDEMDDEEDAAVLAIPGEGVSGSSSHHGNTIPHPHPNSGSAEEATPHSQLIDDEKPLPPYTLQDALDASQVFEHTFALLIYDPDDDAFHGLYSQRHYWVSGCEKLLSSVRHTASFLRKLFPNRFCGRECAELIVPISSGDYPGVKSACLDRLRRAASDPRTPPGWQSILSRGCHSSVAPVLHYGSVFRQPRLFPSMIAMPMPDRHNLYCFATWAMHGSVCRQMRPASAEDPRAELVFGEELGLQWEDLTPQIVWRGTDFGYLGKLHPSLHKPQLRSQTREEERTKEIGAGLMAVDVAKKKQSVRKSEESLATFSKAAVVQSLRQQYDQLLPRWKAVVLTAEAEVEATGLHGEPDRLPWANMKFSSYIHAGSKARTEGADRYKEWEGIGFATGQYMGKQEMAKYKYHIDLGGGGGTTWTGTLDKLAMPGLLFHHMTPTKDYIHTWMQPWVHYIPVQASLLDLKRKYEWATSHPEESNRIAGEATKLMRHLTSPKGYGELYQRHVVEPLRRVVEAYQPVKTLQTQTSGRNWKEALRQIAGEGAFVPVIKCSGASVKSCEQIQGKADLRQALGRRTRNASKGFIPQVFDWSK